MKRSWILLVISANLAALFALAFIYPGPMVSPGPLVPAHAKLESDCFACHKPFMGVSTGKCVACHAVATIGLKTTAGAPTATKGNRVPFHQALVSQNCMACHGDHPGLGMSTIAQGKFSHAMIDASMNANCVSCHAAPATPLHKDLKVPCSSCHRQDAWKPATFSHAGLSPSQLANCASCHKAPLDELHRNLSSNCKFCHSQTAWKPVDFDHNRYFVLDQDHRATCVTCHPASNYRQYTCYGCHEHSKSSMIAEHADEGIRDIDNCVRCHRSTRGEGGGDD